jgi:hypothetical protein
LFPAKSSTIKLRDIGHPGEGRLAMGILLNLISDLMHFIRIALEMILIAGMLIAVALAAEAVHVIHNRVMHHRAEARAKSGPRPGAPGGVASRAA